MAERAFGPKDMTAALVDAGVDDPSRGAIREHGSVSDDAFLGGRLRLLQPAKGYRAGMDAVLLAAAARAVDEGEARLILDAGAGVGTVGLCLACQIAGARCVLVEKQAGLVTLAADNIKRNGLTDRVSVCAADLTASGRDLEALGLLPQTFSDVVMNPPYFVEGAGTRAEDEGKAAAHAMPAGGVQAWLRLAVRMLEPGGRLFLINTPSVLNDLLAACEGRFGGLVVKPVLPYSGAEATRILLFGRKGSRAPLRIAPPFVLHDDACLGGRRPLRAAAAAVFQDGAGLARWFEHPAG